MGSTGAIIILTAFVTFGLSIWGLFNRGRSILCALAGIVVLFGAGMGAMHAWGESRSIPWTVGYLIVALIGIVSALRQVWARAQEPENAEQSPGGDAPKAAPEE